MRAKDAARKIERLGGEVTKTVLMRYGVPEREAIWYTHNHPAKKKASARKKRHPVIIFGHCTR